MQNTKIGRHVFQIHFSGVGGNAIAKDKLNHLKIVQLPGGLYDFRLTSNANFCLLDDLLISHNNQIFKI